MALVHTRIVIKEVGRRLSEYEDSHELVSVLLDAMVAHKDAWEKAEILHRDISTGNIIIHDGKGILIDWDLSKPRSRLGKGARTRERSVSNLIDCPCVWFSDQMYARVLCHSFLL